MYCLYCGHCCQTMSPFSEHGQPCKFLVAENSFCFCSIYNKRPTACINHSFDCHVCPIGLDILGIKDTEALRQRLELGYEKELRLGGKR